MAYKILTKNGIDNSNIDGARGEYFNSGMRDGIVQGILNEGTFIASSSNVISLDTCELRIAGHRIVIDEPVYHTFSNAPSADTRYAFVAQIVVDDNQNVDFSLFVQTASTPLIQNNIYKNITGAGTYQVEIGRFTLKTSLQIENVVRTLDVITGFNGVEGGSSISIGTVSTNTLSENARAEVDIDSVFNEEDKQQYLNFKFGIPIGKTSLIGYIMEINFVPEQGGTYAYEWNFENNGVALNSTFNRTPEVGEMCSITLCNVNDNKKYTATIYILSFSGNVTNGMLNYSIVRLLDYGSDEGIELYRHFITLEINYEIVNGYIYIELINSNSSQLVTLTDVSSSMYGDTIGSGYYQVSGNSMNIIQKVSPRSSGIFISGLSFSGDVSSGYALQIFGVTLGSEMPVNSIVDNVSKIQ